jgi:ribosomal protein S20
MDKNLDNKTETKKDVSLNSNLILLGNNKLSFCYKKTSKLLKAIYFLTDKKVNDKELINSLRSTARGVVKDILDIFVDKEKDKKKESLVGIFFAISLIDTLVVEGVIDEDNGIVLQEEYMKVVSVLEIFSDEKRENNSFMQTLSGIRNELSLTNSDVFDLNKNVGKELSGKREVVFGSNNITVSKFNTQRDYLDKGQSEYKRQNSSTLKDNNRQNVIMDTIKKKGVVTIKDISTVLSDVSEKTVQREILSLVDKGLINKEGERRWSKYSLAQI